MKPPKWAFQGNSQAEKFAELIWNLFLGKVVLANLKILTY